jgi:hypothetical protein
VAPLHSYRVMPTAREAFPGAPAAPVSRIPIGLDDPTLRPKIEAAEAAADPADANRPLTYRVVVDDETPAPAPAAEAPSAPPRPSDPAAYASVPDAPPEALRLEAVSEEASAQPEPQPEPTTPSAEAAPAEPAARRRSKRPRKEARPAPVKPRGRSFWRSLGRILVGTLGVTGGAAAGYCFEVPWVHVEQLLRAALAGAMGLLVSSIIGRWIFGRP